MNIKQISKHLLWASNWSIMEQVKLQRFSEKNANALEIRKKESVSSILRENGNVH